MKLHIGTSGFAYPAWKGKFYPAKWPKAKMLHYYAERFDSVEINSTFRGLPNEESLTNWKAAVPKEFRFAFKVPQRITHILRLNNANDEMTEFVESLKRMKTQCGPLLIQLPPNFKKDLERLQVFLKALPKRKQYAIEFRHASWLEEDVCALLRKLKVALCIADSENTPPIPFIATANWGYLRLRREQYSKAQLKAWAVKIRDQNWSEAFVYFRHEDKANGPRFADQLQSIMQD